MSKDHIDRIKKHRQRKHDASEYIEGIINGNRNMLSQAITVVESSKPEDRELAHAIIEGCLPHSGDSIRVGITGVPGVGKSTFIETFGNHIIQTGHKPAILAIDPSSGRSGGSILGDKTRMETLSMSENAYIRPTAAGDSLGGVARHTRESIILCEAAGFDVIIVETVGVGQSETAVHSMVDFFLLLMLAGAGDELQGIKRGIMEMADALVITKADGENIDPSTEAKRQYKAALHLYPPRPSGWKTEVMTCSALKNEGIEEIWQMIVNFFVSMSEKGLILENRQQQAVYWMDEAIRGIMQQNFHANEDVDKALPVLREKVLNGEMSPFRAAEELMGVYLGVR